jgi:hypothetical protein
MQQGYDLQTFKRDINLADFSTTFGYSLDRKKSTKTSIAMKSGSDKIIISKKGGFWVFFSVTDDQDSGTIIDFIAHRTQWPIPDIGKHLAKWNGSDVSTLSSSVTIQEPKHDPTRVRAIFAKCRPLTDCSYLESRGLALELLTSKRFAGRIFNDRYGNVAFPHFRNREVCGLELKNCERGLLVKGSQKTFWRSNIKRSDQVLVIAESVIDALSYQQTHRLSNAAFLATGGGLSRRQCSILCSMLKATPCVQTIILATDNDDGGVRIASQLAAALEQTSFSGEVIKHSPKFEGEDWNDVLVGKSKSLSQTWDVCVKPFPQSVQP